MSYTQLGPSSLWPVAKGAKLASCGKSARLVTSIVAANQPLRPIGRESILIW